MKKTCIIFTGKMDFGPTEREQKALIKKHLQSKGLSDFYFKYENKGNRSKFELNELLSTEKKDDYTLAIWKLDALDHAFSKMDEMISFLNMLSERGVRFISVADQLDTELPAMLFFKDLLSIFQSFKTNMKSQHIRTSIFKAKAHGVQLGRPKVGDKKEVLKMRTLGLSLNDIASRLRISRPTVQRIIKACRTT